MVRRDGIRLLALLLVACANAVEPRGLDGGPADAGPGDAGPGDAGPPETVVRVHYPAMGRQVTLRGSEGPLSWSSGVPLAAGQDDTFTWTTTALSEVTECKPLLDDAAWSRGPNYHLAPGQTLDIYPRFTSTQGEVRKLFTAFSSAVLGNTRAVWVYLPPSYAENTRARYPVVYMHDGQNLFDAQLAFAGVEWQVDEAFDAAAESGCCPGGQTCQNDGECGGSRCETFREAIVVGPANTSDRMEEYTPTRDSTEGAGGKGDLYLRMLIEELKPQVDQALRTLAGPAHTGLMGSSLGGLISAYGGVRRAEVFGLVGVLSPSTWWDDRMIIGEVQSIPGRQERALRVYLDSGDTGIEGNDDVDNTALLAQAYLAAGYVDGVSLRYLVAHGHEHNEYYWALRLPGALGFLLGPR